MIFDEPPRLPQKPGSVRNFLKKAAVFWVVLLVIFVAIGLFGPVVGTGYGYTRTSEFLLGFNGVLFISGVVGVPLIMVLAVVLGAVQRFIDGL